MNNLHRLGMLFFLVPAAAVGCGDNIGVGDDGGDDSGDPPDAAIEPMVDAPPPPPPGVAFLDYLLAIDITPDGATAVFEDMTSTEATIHLYDTITGETTIGGVVGDPSRNVATAISATRRITALHNEPVQAGVWTDAGGWVDLGSPHAVGCGADEISGAFDISADGSVVVGLAWDGCSPDAFRWTDASGSGAFTSLERLGMPFDGSPNPPSNRASVISDDGTVIAGFAQNGPVDRSPAVWLADGSGFMIDETNVDVPGEFLSISADGATLAGIWGYDGFVWTSASGVVWIPRLDISLPSDPVYPNAIAGGGRLVFGGIGSPWFSVPVAFVWTADAGTRVLADVAAASGVAMPEGMVLNNVLAASSDGSVLIGVATDAEWNTKTFVLRLPESAFDL